MQVFGKIAKMMGGAMVFLIALVVLVIVALQLRPVKNKITEVAQKEVNNILQAELSVKSIDGNFIGRLEFNEVLLMLDRDTVGYIPEVKLKYSLLSLLCGVVRIESIELESPLLYLVQNSDSTWNFSHITPPKEHADTVTKSFGMEIRVERLSVNNGDVHVRMLDTVLPRRISEFYVDLGLRYSQAEQTVDMREMRFNTHQPHLILGRLSFMMKNDTTSFRLDKLLLQTAHNQITAHAHIFPQEWTNSYVHLETAPIRIDEFQELLLPLKTLKMSGTPILKLAATMNRGLSNVDLQLKDPKQGIRVQMESENLVHFLNEKGQDTLQFKLKGQFDDLDLRRWIDDPTMDYRIAGKWLAQGAGVDYKTMRLTFDANFRDVMVLKRQMRKLAIAFDYTAGNLDGVLNASGNFGSVTLKPAVKGLWKSTPSYSTHIAMRQLDLSKLLLNEQLKSDLTFNGQLKGVGVAPQTMSAVFAGKLIDGRMYGTSVGLLDVVLNYQKGNAEAELMSEGEFGKVVLHAHARRMLSKYPEYTAFVATEDLNLGSLLNNDSLVSRLNMELDVVGSGFDPKGMNVNVALNAQPSSLVGIGIQRLNLKANYGNDNINLDSLRLITETMDLRARGNYSFVGNSDLMLNAELANASEIARVLKLDSLETSGNLHARASGTVDSLHLAVDFGLDETRFGSNMVGSVQGKIQSVLSSNDTILNAVITAKSIAATGFSLDSVAFYANSDMAFTDFELNVAGTDIDAELAGNIALGEDILLKMNDVCVDYKGSNWQLDQPTTLRIGKEEYEIKDFRFMSGGQEQSVDSMQIIHADGLISRKEEQNFDLKLFNVDIASLLNLFDFDRSIKGMLNMSMYVRGTADAPQLESGFSVNNASVNDYAFTEVAGTMAFVNEKLKMGAGIIPKDSGRVDIAGYIPLGLRLDSMRLVPPAHNDSIHLRLLLEKIPLRIIRSFYPVDKAEGYVLGDIAVNGTLEDPNPAGNLQIVNGKMALKKYGIDYRELAAAIRFEKEAVRVDTVLIRSKAGSMLAHGSVGFNSQFYKGDIQNSDITINFNQFQPLDHRYYNMKLSGDAALRGKKDSVYFDGDVNILEALVYLPAIMNLTGRSKPADIPLPELIAALERTNQKPDSVIFRFRNIAERPDSLKLNYFDNVQGKIKVFIPRNTWIKNEQMRFELAGDMEFIKHRDFVELFGNVDVIRGQYEMLGKTFVVDEGTITFQGGKDLNPMLDIVASYNVRSQNQTTGKLSINVTGNLREPKVAFRMGGEELNEGDALSYILFGTNMDALTSGQQAAMTTPSAGSLATSAAASLLSSELTKLLGRTLDVDYIEMRAGSSFENATFVVGKYITNKLFMSYERRFGDFKEEQVADYEVKLEYELFRYLFLQLASSSINNGADIIFKINSKTNFNE